MDVKTTFFNGNVEETILWFNQKVHCKGSKMKVCDLQKSIYGLEQASRSWNISFDQTVKSFGIIQCPDEPCVYKRCKDT